jgi:hypothetical protein
MQELMKKHGISPGEGLKFDNEDYGEEISEEEEID